MTTTAPEARNEAALAQAVDRWNAGDLDGYLEIYADDVRLHGFGPGPLGKDGGRAFYEDLVAAFPGSRLQLHDTFGAGDRLTARFTLTGRHEGTFMGVPATGREIALAGITILHFRDGACVERWSCSDVLGVLVQIGAVPPPR
ncbi:MAG TPA: ester cyclase [Actinomycetospora sp.]|nr:ester cyclase [Actinomycetospora sp.]